MPHCTWHCSCTYAYRNTSSLVDEPLPLPFPSPLLTYSPSAGCRGRFQRLLLGLLGSAPSLSFAAPFGSPTLAAPRTAHQASIP